MLKGAFSFGFNHRIVNNGAQAGIFEEESKNQKQEMVIATDTNKIVLQNSDAIFHVNEPVQYLGVYPIKRVPNTSALMNSSFSTGMNLMKSSTDAVIIGTRTGLMAYDVFNNKTLFHRDMPDGVNVIKVGILDNYSEPIIICGCGTTIWGIKINGEDCFWTVLGDEINTLELCDMDGDGRNELLVGSNGSEIKVFKNTSFWAEYDEGEPTKILCAFQTGTFAFALVTGIIGVYSHGERLWRIKAKTQLLSLLAYPDANHLICVWHNGKIDMRLVDSGEIIFKDQVGGDNGDLVSVFLADLNNTGKPQITIVLRNGQIYGVEYQKDEYSRVNETQKLIREYGQKRHNLLEELRSYERHEKEENETSTIPANTNLDCFLNLSLEKGLCINLTVANNIPIRAVLIFAEGIFDSECYSIHPNGEESSKLVAYFSQARDFRSDLYIKVFAGFSMERQMVVFEVEMMLPKFAAFLNVAFINPEKEPHSYIEFNLGTRPTNLNTWLFDNFMEFANIENVWDDNGTFNAKFICTRNGEPLIIEIAASGIGRIRHNNMESCANLIQSICAHLNIKDLECKAYFPEVLASIQNVIDTMNDKYEINDRLSGDWAERLNVVRECIVRAEDLLAIQNAVEARKFYVRVAMLNREMVAQHSIRMNAKEELLSSLKTLNKTIEQFAHLRVGTPASKLIQNCRKAIANENLAILPKLLQHEG